MFNKFILMILVLAGPGALAFADGMAPAPAKPATALSDEDEALFEKALPLYYSYRRAGLRKFKCQIKEKYWEVFKKEAIAPLMELRNGFSIYYSLKNYKKILAGMSEKQKREMETTREEMRRVFYERELKKEKTEAAVRSKAAPFTDLPFEKFCAFLEQVDGMKCFLSYTGKEGFRFSHTDYTPGGFLSLDDTVKSLLDMIQAESQMFGEIWGVFSSMTMPEEGSDPNCRVIETEKGYTVEVTSEDGISIFFLTDKLLLAEARMSLPPEVGGFINMKFSFNNTSQGFLVKSISFTAKKGTIKGIIEVEYGEFEHFKMPKKMKWEYQETTENNKCENYHNTLEFFDYQIN